MDTRPSESANFHIAPINVSSKSPMPTIYELQSEYRDLVCEDHTIVSLGNSHIFRGIERLEASSLKLCTSSEDLAVDNCLESATTEDFGCLCLSGSMDIADGEQLELTAGQTEVSALRNSELGNDSAEYGHCQVQYSVVRAENPKCVHKSEFGTAARCPACGQVFIAAE